MTRFYHNFLSVCRDAIHKLSHVKAVTLLLGESFLFFFLHVKRILQLLDPTFSPIRLRYRICHDTVKPSSFTWSDDSILTSNQYYGYLGTIHDPYFGNTTGRLVTQLRLGAKWDDEIYTVDSVKMFLTFRNVRGDVDLNPMLKISEIAEEYLPIQNITRIMIFN
jgi:hypothetical protein